jgi:hypothetical protein
MKRGQVDGSLRRFNSLMVCRYFHACVGRWTRGFFTWALDSRRVDCGMRTTPSGIFVLFGHHPRPLFFDWSFRSRGWAWRSSSPTNETNLRGNDILTRNVATADRWWANPPVLGRHAECWSSTLIQRIECTSDVTRLVQDESYYLFIYFLLS